MLESVHFLNVLVVYCGPGALHSDLRKSEGLDQKGSQKWP